MTKQKQMTEKELTQSVELSDKELDEISGGPNRIPYAQQVCFLCAWALSKKIYTNSNGISATIAKLGYSRFATRQR